MINESPSQNVGFISVLKSVAAAFFGVQSARNRERDFAHGKPIHYIVIGLLATGLFVVGVWLIVKLVLNLAGV
ncbi:MAG: DUF2970 domain-containing protein [Thiotrichales bacterium]